MMHGRGKSDRSIVPEKSPNKALAQAAEGMEGRELAKGNSQERNAPGHRAGHARQARWSGCDRQHARTGSSGSLRSSTTFTTSTSSGGRTSE